MHSSPLTLLLGLCLLAPTAQAGRRGTPDVVEDAMAFALTDRAKSIRLLEGALADGTPAKKQDEVMVHAGEQNRLSGNRDAAHRWFSKVVADGRGSEVEAARLGMILLEAGDGLDSRILAVLQDVAEKDALATQNADRYMLLAIQAGRDGQTSRMTGLMRKAVSYAKDDPEVYDRVRSTLDQVANARPSEEPITLDAAPPTATGGTTRLDKARAALAERRPDEARKHATAALEAAEPDSLEHRRAAYMLQRIDAAPVSRSTIAVLLPLSGKYEGIGNSMRQALEFGYTREGGTRKLVFIDSGATPQTAVKALEDAVLRKGVIAVVGPLLTDETEAVVGAAEALEVPLLSLSQALEDTEELEWTLQAMVTIRDQVDALVEAVTADGLTRFAVIAPRSSYGERATDEFREAVTASGGKVVAVELYPDDATDFLPHAQALGRKDPEARKRELWELREEAKKAGRDPGKVVLPPTLDFQALFLPENAKRIPLVCAALAYEEFPMGDFQPHKDSPVIPMLGLNGWNNDFLVASGGPYVRMSYFPDSFAAPLPEPADPNDQVVWTPDPTSLAFVDAYRLETNRTPKPLEAVVSDAGRVLAAATKSDASDREAFRDALLAAKPTVSVTGVTGFDAESRRLDRDLLILTVVKEGILPRDQAPEQPER